jgi:protein-disulfide isomerase
MKRFLLVCLSIAITVLGLVGSASAAASACDELDAAQKKAAAEILASQHAYDCCDKSLAECLKQKPVCRLVKRLSEDVCRRVKKGQARADIERELSRRATSMSPTGNSYRIDTNGSTPIGKPDTKVTIITYVCPHYPFCTHLMNDLEKSIASGKLSGKVKLYARVFPVRSHKGSTEAGLGMLAAEKLGKFWEFLLKLYADFDKFDIAQLPEVAAAVGMDKQKFTDEMNDPKTRERLVDSKKEGVRNGVESTPTLFINGRKYTGELHLSAVEDVLEEEHDRLTGKQYE